MRNAGGDEAQKSPSHRQGHQRCDHGIDEHCHGAHHVEPRRDDRRRDHPDSEAGDEETDHLGAKPPQTTLQRHPAALDEPLDRIVVVCRPAEQIGHHDEHRRGEERELGASLKQLGRPPDEHGNEGCRQGRHSLGPSSLCRREAGQPDHERRPDHGRLRTHEQQIAAGDADGRQQRPAAADRQQLQEPADGIREDADVQSRDRKDVGRAGHSEELGISPVKCRPFAEQQRGRQA
jgi:hypothetical protein